jgi:predicted regulator of Ras-like GTPase activity (Roadblock/LC7/MglB family)
MQPISQRFDAGLTETLRQQLESFVSATPGARLAVLTSGDGFEITAHPRGLPTVQRLAAMSSSLQALSEAMVQEAGLVNIRNLIIESDGGTVIVLGIGTVIPRLSLTVVAADDETLGRLLWAARECRAALEQRLAHSSV